MGTQHITPARKVALVIGVNGLPASGQPELRYAEASAARLAELLARPACGFELHGGEPLLGAQATSEAIRTALLDLARELGPDDLLLISFTGHGVWQT
ncbi:MAG TPA: caspase family protein, partial [Roseiflexaceae bacterium]|nr:caspase family protein [Roseiflexaceae bacterium]